MTVGKTTKRTIVSIALTDLEVEMLRGLMETQILNKSDAFRMGLWLMCEKYSPNFSSSENIDYIIERKVETILKEKLKEVGL